MKNNEIIIKTSLTNAYGRVQFVKKGDDYYMMLGNYNGENKVRVSKAMFDEAEKIDWSEDE